MAIFHLSVKAISRSTGRTATAAAAYRASVEITDIRTGEIHDYTRKRGVVSADLVLPDKSPDWAKDRSALWNAAELAEKRKDSCVAREIVVALPSELSISERKRLAIDFAKEMADKEGCAIDVAIHEPNKEGDDRNHHAHILRTTRKLGEDGLGEKLDTEKAGRARSADLEVLRARWAELTNARLLENGINTQIDHRSLKEQGIEREPTHHLGVHAIGYERRTGKISERRKFINEDIGNRIQEAKIRGELERQSAQSQSMIIDLSTDIQAAKTEQKKQQELAAMKAAKERLELFKNERAAIAQAQAKLEEMKKSGELDIKKESVINPENKPEQAKEPVKKQDKGWEIDI